MTNGISIAIPLGFMLLAAVLCWYMAYTKGRWPLKLILTGMLILFSLEVRGALTSYSGWATQEQMPKRALLLHAVVREPNPARHDAGAIFLWVVPLGLDDPDPFSYRPISGEPRAYRLPYSRPGHEQAEQASKLIQKNGRPVLIERDGNPGGGGGEPRDGNSTTYDDGSGGGFHIGDQPGPSLPDKAANDPHGH